MGAGYTVFGDGISNDDARQGEIGNCGFIASMASMAKQQPGLVKKAFLS